MVKSGLALFSFLLVLALLVAGCGSSTPAATTTTTTSQVTTSTSVPTTATTPPTSTTQPKSGGTFTWIHNGGITEIASVVDGATSYRSLIPVFDNLLTVDSNGTPQPNLADSWQVSPDGKSITFKLHKGIKFHDGTDFNAEAVKYNLEQMYANNVRGASSLAAITSYDIQDDYTIVFSMDAYDALLIARLAQTTIGMIASPTALKKETTAENKAQLHCVGTGPFIFDGWARDTYVNYKANPNYWKGKPYLDNLVIKNIADRSVGIMGLKAGEADAIATVDPVDGLALQADGYVLQRGTILFIHSFVPDGVNPNSPFADIRVREALEYAIDKEAMAEGIGMGFFDVAYQAALPDDPYYVSGLTERKYDPAKAKQLLADAGYAGGFTTKIVSDVRVRQDQLVAVQTYLAEVGIQTELEMLDVAKSTSVDQNGWEGIYFPGFPVPNTLYSVASSWGSTTSRASVYRPAGYMDKWAALYTQSDQTKLIAQWQELVKIMEEQCMYIPYQADRSLDALAPYVHGFLLRGNKTVDYWEPAKVWLDK